MNSDISYNSHFYISDSDSLDSQFKLLEKNDLTHNDDPTIFPVKPNDTFFNIMKLAISGKPLKINDVDEPEDNGWKIISGIPFICSNDSTLEIIKYDEINKIYENEFIKVKYLLKYNLN